MAGLDKNTPSPTEIKLHQKSRVLENACANRQHFKLPYEFLRVYSASAAVRGHGPGQEGKMSHPFRECSTLSNSGTPRDSHSLPGRQRSGGSPLSRTWEREIDEHSTSRTNHYFRHEY